jgi:hypothetical protein
MVKVMQAHSDCLQIVQDAMYYVFRDASELLFDEDPVPRAIFVYMVDPMIDHGVIALVLESMTLHIFLFYGGPGTVVDIARDTGVVHVDDDGDKDHSTTCGFGVVLAMMKAYPHVKFIQYYGFVVFTLSAMAGISPQKPGAYRARLRQLGVLDAISSVKSARRPKRPWRFSKTRCRSS